MTFEEYEKVISELWHVSLELYHEKNINVSSEISDIDFKLSRNYKQERLETYEVLLEKYKERLKE